MKRLLACCSLFLSTVGFGQAIPYNPLETDNFWIEGKTVTLAYSNLNAPAGVTNAAALQLLGEIEAKLDGLNINGLSVQVDTTVRATGCASPGQNTVIVCWGTVPGNTSTFETNLGGSGTSFYQQGTVVLGTETTWTSTGVVYMNVFHQLMHILGFQHPVIPNTSVLNGAADLTQVDIDGLRNLYATRCTLSYTSTRDIAIPYVTYRGNAYKATIHHNGGTSFSLLGNTVQMYSATNPPLTPCQSVAVDGNNQLHLPSVNVNGAIYWGDLTLANGSLTLTGHGVK